MSRASEITAVCVLRTHFTAAVGLVTVKGNVGKKKKKDSNIVRRGR